MSTTKPSVGVRWIWRISCRLTSWVTTVIYTWSIPNVCCLWFFWTWFSFWWSLFSDFREDFPYPLPCGTSHSTTSVYCVTFAPCFSLESLGVVGRISPSFGVQNWSKLGKNSLTWKAIQDSKKSKGSLMYPPAGTDRTVASPSARIEISISWREDVISIQRKDPEISYRSHLTMRALIHVLRTRQYDRKKDVDSSCTLKNA